MKYITSYILIAVSFALLSCEPNNATDATSPVVYIATLQDHFVPDRRVARLDVEAKEKNGQWVLTGETSLPQAKDSLLSLLTTNNISFDDQIIVWPESSLGEKNYAITRHSVANLRSERGHSQELATQVLLGTPLRVLKKEKEWYFVQCPDGYLAWIHGGELALKTKKELNQWKQSKRVVFIGDYSHSYQDVDNQQIVGDLVNGDLLQQLGVQENDLVNVVYPDGRTAYVKVNETQGFNEYLDEHALGFEQTLTIAYKQIGKPYLWGGTSPKAMDCSGFTKTLYWQQGLILPRDASQQVKAGVEVKYDDQLNGLEKGDLLFFGRFREDGSEKITHVGLYIGNGRFIHSGSDNGANKEESLLPDTPGYAEHRRASLLRARRLNAGGPMVLAVKEHEWYF